MNDKDSIKDLFSEKLGNYEAQVRPELWSSISSKMAATTVGTATGATLLTKIIIGSSITAAALVGGYFIYTSSDETQAPTEVATVKSNPTQTNVISEDDQTKIENKTTDTERVKTERIENKVDFNSLESNELVQQQVEEIVAPVIINEKPIAPIKEKPEFYKEEKKEQNTPTPEVKKEDNKKTVTPPPVQESIAAQGILDEDLPNIFTPNNDGVNDELLIKSEGLNDFSIVVMDSKNQVVYKSNDPNFRWNGIGLNGEMVEGGDYLYYLTAFDSNGKAINKYKRLTIKKQ